MVSHIQSFNFYIHLLSLNMFRNLLNNHKNIKLYNCNVNIHINNIYNKYLTTAIVNNINNVSIRAFEKQFKLSNIIFFHINNINISKDQQQYIKNIQNNGKHCYLISDQLYNNVSI